MIGNRRKIIDSGLILVKKQQQTPNQIFNKDLDDLPYDPAANIKISKIP